MRKKLRQSQTVQGGSLVAIVTAIPALVPFLPPQAREFALAAIAAVGPIAKGIGILWAAIGARKAIAANGSGK